MFSGLIANVIVEAAAPNATLLQARRRHCFGRGCTKGARSRVAGELRQGARCAQAARRRQTCRVSSTCLMATLRSRSSRHPLPRRPRRLRRASGVRGRRRALCAKTVEFVSSRFLPGDAGRWRCVKTARRCRDPSSERMTFVDASPGDLRIAWRRAHGPSDDPPFDRAVLLGQRGDVRERASPRPRAIRWHAACRRSEFRPYASRARWVQHCQRQLLHRHDLSRKGCPRCCSPPTCTMRSGASSRRSTAGPFIRPPKAMPPWRTLRSRWRAKCSACRP